MDTTLTTQQILDVYFSPLSLAKLARQYQVSRTTIANIKSGHTYTYVTNPQIRLNALRSELLTLQQSAALVDWELTVMIENCRLYEQTKQAHRGTSTRDS